MINDVINKNDDANQSAFENMVCYSNYIAEMCEPLFKAFGVTNFNYTEFHADDTLLLLNSDAHFLKKQSDINNIAKLPEILNAFSQPGFYLQDAESCIYSTYYQEDNYQQLLAELNYGHIFHYFQKVNKNNGQSLILHYTVSAPINMHNANYIYLNHIEEFFSFFQYLNKRISNQIKQMPRLVCAGIKNSNMFCSPENKFDHDQFLQTLNLFKLKKINTKKPALSKREQEILRHILQGISPQEISKISGRSKRTIECQLSNLRKRYGSKNTIQLVYKLLSQGADFIS